MQYEGSFSPKKAAEEQAAPPGPRPATERQTIVALPGRTWSSGARASVSAREAEEGLEAILARHVMRESPWGFRQGEQESGQVGRPLALAEEESRTPPSLNAIHAWRGSQSRNSSRMILETSIS
jgi:hypothetical protein